MSNEQLGDTPSLNLVSLQNAADIINVANQRNAFKIEELEIVGKTYNEITNFIKLTQKQNISQTDNHIPTENGNNITNCNNIKNT